MKRSVADLATIGLFGCALVLTAVVVRREFFGKPGQDSLFQRINPTPQLTQVGRLMAGKQADPVAIVVFGDFECPFCAKALPVIDSVRTKYSDRVKVLYRHLPLETLHPNAWRAALAAECAGDQGKFREYHDLLYRLQDSIGRLEWRTFASRAGVTDLKDFDSCVKDERDTHAVERDVLLARSLHLRGTPVFIIGDEMVQGVPPFAWMERRIARLRDGA